MNESRVTRRALLLAAPAVVPVVVVLAGSLGAALLQSVGLMPFTGPATFTLEPWTSNAALYWTGHVHA
ncbi:hypothetical protein [Arthrobacter sp. H14]|uniref:hypothetical protein n=1 Tax=Arthrobacter sp. H14 TaxID=1312959 RepID=UPI00047E5C69|nr:hypothetical protein [Arthrobacter sp. H14]